jgi:glyceraldehyde-3-phosphate dehydrogenase (NADP+)
MHLAAKEIVIGGFSYAGQRCTGVKYVLAESSVLDTLIPLVIQEVQTRVVPGNPKDDTTKLVGPLISQKAAEDVQQVVDEAIAQGATIVMGGKRNGAYMEPTILKNVRPNMRVISEETFGPVVCFVEIHSPEEGASLVNASDYGLQASIFSQDETAALAFAKNLQVGTVQLNGSPQRGPDNFPFMGVKKSGLGVQGVRYSLLAMSRLFSVVINKS